MIKKRVSSILYLLALALLHLLVLLVLIGTQHKTASAAAACPQPATPVNLEHVSVKIAEVEVSQGLATQGPYIVGRSTALLVHLDVSTNTVPLCGILQVHRANMTTHVLRATNQPLFFDQSSANDEARSLIFGPLSIEQPSMITLAVKIFSPVDPTLVLASAIVPNLAFTTEVAQPFFYYSRVNFGVVGQPTDTLVAQGSGDTLLRGVWPAPDMDEQWLYTETIDFSDPITDLGHDNKLVAGSDGKALLKRLAEQKEAIVTKYAISGQRTITAGVHELVFMHGWIRDVDGDVVVSNGNSNDLLRVSYSTSYVPLGQLIFTHELFHVLGQNHSQKPTIGVNGWDVRQYLPGKWPFQEAVQQRKPPLTYSIMNKINETLQATANSWIAPVDYTFLVNCFGHPELAGYTYLSRVCAPSAEVAITEQPACVVQNGYVFMDILNEFGTGLETLSPVRLNPWWSQPTSTFTSLQGPQPFALLFLQDGVRIAEIPFDATMTFINRDGTEEARPGLFRVLVPEDIVNLADTVTIRNNRTGQIIPYLSRSANPPGIEIVQPTAGSVLTGQVTVNITDIDQAGQPITPSFFVTSTQVITPAEPQGAASDTTQPITCRFTYSPDNGTTWIPLKVDVACNPGQHTITFDSTKLPPSEGAGVVRAFVSDDLTVRYADVSGLTVQRASGPILRGAIE